MQLTVTSAPVNEIQADWLVLPVWEDGLSPAAAIVDDRLGGVLTRLREGQDASGKPGELVPLFEQKGLGTSRLLLLGLGKREDVTRLALSRAAMAAAKFLSAKKRDRIALALPDPVAGLPWPDLLLALAAGLTRGVHGPGIRQADPKRFEPEEFQLVAPSGAPMEELRQAARRAEVEGGAVLLARNLVNEPPCDLYPESFARRAQELCKKLDLSCSVLDEKQIVAERMGCLLGVAQGSVRPPRVVVLRHQPNRTGPVLGLIGKGVTFDSGGLSLKTNEQMLEMKCDMAGAATVLAAVTAIAELKLPVNVLGVLALVENLPSGQALKLGDVLKARNGKTVEVLNTDAEGRLILADALTYAVDQKASHLVDLATLTGACIVALGTEVAGLMTNDQPWADRVIDAISRAGERAWQLPMFDDYTELLKSQVADLKNVGGKYAGAITAAKFLQQFVGDTPWVHLDIAGPAFVSEETPARDSGGTGCLVRSLVELGDNWA